MALTTFNADRETVAGIVRKTWEGTAIGKLVSPKLADTGNTVICPSLTFQGAAWVNEAEEITVADGVYAEVVAPVRKVAALSQLSNEAVSQLRSRGRSGDSDELFNAYYEMTEALRSDLGDAIDAAFCQDLSENGKAPKGVLATEGVTEVNGGLTVDKIVSANSNALALTGKGLAGVLVSVEAAAALAQIKAADGSNEYLYAYTPNGELSVQGVRVIPTHNMADDVDAICVPQRGIVVGGNLNGRLEQSQDFGFANDVLTLRGVMYAGFAFGVPAAVTVVKSA